MKRLFLILLLMLLVLPFRGDAGMIIRILSEAAPPGTPLCSETFTTGDTGDVAGNSMFDGETDTSSRLDISSNYMRFFADDAGVNSGFVTDTSGCFSSNTEVTIKFKIMFTDVVDVASGATGNRILYIADSDSIIVWALVTTNSGGDLTGFRAYRGNGTEAGNAVTGTIDADTWYDGYVYYLEDPSAGGVEMKIGSLSVSNAGFNDDTSADNGVYSFDLGLRLNDLGSGTNDAYVCFDDVEVYDGDER